MRFGAKAHLQYERQQPQSRGPLRDLAIGFVLALGAFLFFVKFLNVGLPGGWLTPLLGAAGT